MSVYIFLCIYLVWYNATYAKCIKLYKTITSVLRVGTCSQPELT